MAGFESFGGRNRGKSKEEQMSASDVSNNAEKELSVEETKDLLFDQYLKQQLVEDFFENLQEYLEDEDVDLMRGELAQHEDADIYSALSLPHELREKKFSAFKKEIDEGKKPNEVMRTFIDTGRRYGYGIGYHTSPNDIKPKEDGQWNITGSEQDHRDDDLSKAYYSTKYRHLFKKKDPKFIYIVRTDPETHRTDGNWSRAGRLSVVSRVPFSDVVEYVESTSRDIKEEKTGA